MNFCATIITLALLAVHDAEPLPKVDVSQQEVQVIAANGRFANKMYKSLAEEAGNKNVLFSPFSAHAALSMLYQAAGGATRDAMAEGLSVPAQDVVAEGYHNLLERIGGSERVRLSVANKAFVNDQKHVKQTFKDIVAAQFQSEVDSVDFSDAPAAVEIINSWVEGKTEKKITGLVQNGDVTPQTEVVLVNAVYFKGNWFHPFGEHSTKSEPFYLNKDDTISHEMMHRFLDHLYYKDDKDLDAQIVQIPYADLDYSMVVVLPHQKDGLADLESKLVESDLSKIMEGSENKKMDLALPKFKFEQRMSLKKHLTDIGMGNIFGTDADLSGMVEENNVVVSDVVQKTFISVDEIGTEAAAATAIITLGSALDLSEPVRFVADHPFVFLLVKTDRSISPSPVSVLFYGRIENPAS